MSALGEMIDQLSRQPLQEIDPRRSALICIDLQQDELDDKGFLAAKLNCDIGRYREVVPRAAYLIGRCREREIPVVAVQAVYDYAYLSKPARARFEALHAEGVYALKGDAGTEFVPAILAAGVDMILVKSNFSSFSPGHTLGYRPGNSELEAYMRRPAAEDADIKAGGGSVMLDYFEAAKAWQPDPDAHLDAGGVLGLDNYLRAKDIDTLIITGGSTHVCVDAAVSGAFERGYRVIMPVDAVAAEATPGEGLLRHELYLSNLGMFKAELTTVDSVVSALD